MLIVDSREQWTQDRRGRIQDTHISDYLVRHNIQWRREMLPVGDYMMDGGSISVDRKQSLEELSHNLLNPADKKRFWAEARLAYNLGIRLIVLVESNRYKAQAEIQGWHSKYSPATGYAVMRQMDKIRRCYGVEFIFCSKRTTAKRIMEILQ